MANPRNLADIAPLVSASGNKLALTNTALLSGGTANGVLYLNGSKEATSGTGLVFDGNNFTLGGSAPKLSANMSGAQNTRLVIQNSTLNGNTRFYLQPNGTGNISAINMWNNSDPNAVNYSSFDIGIIGTTDCRIGSYANGTASLLPLTFYMGSGVEAMRLNTDGKLDVKRLSLTDGNGFSRYALSYSNWGYSTGYKALVIGSTSTSYNTNTTGAVTLAFNYDPSGNNDSSFSGDGRELLFRNGTKFVTPNAANNAFNLNNIVLLDGKVGINLPNPENTLHVSGTARIHSGNATLVLSQSEPTNYAGLRIYNDIGSNVRALEIDYFGSNHSSGERAEIFCTGAYPLLFGTSNQERARITSGGEFVIGGTSASSGFPLTLDKSTGGGLVLKHNGTDKAYFFLNGSTVSRWETVTGATIEVSSGNSNGVSLANGATSWAAISDVRLKTDLVPIQDAVNKLSSIRAVTGRFNTDDVGTSRAFLIAQDVQAVLPEAVDVADDEIKTLGLRYTDTIPLLVAAIKEQQALITDLRARVAALEAKP